MSQTRSSRPSPENMRRLGGAVAIGCAFMAVAFPAAIAAQWVFLSPAELVQARLSPVAATTLAPAGELSLSQRIIGTVGSLIPPLILSWGLLKARRALVAIGGGRFFAPEVVQGLKSYAVAALWSAIASFLIQPVLSAALTFANPAGFRVVSIGISSNHLFEVLGAGIVWVIVASLARGAALAQENEQFV